MLHPHSTYTHTQISKNSYPRPCSAWRWSAALGACVAARGPRADAFAVEGVRARQRSGNLRMLDRVQADRAGGPVTTLQTRLSLGLGLGIALDWATGSNWHVINDIRLWC